MDMQAPINVGIEQRCFAAGCTKCQIRHTDRYNYLNNIKKFTFGRTALHFNRNESEMMMNENILKLLNTHTEFYPHNLEQKFPHLLERIIKFWNSPQFDAHVNQLMLDKREHRRQGFPSEVASEILRLSIIHTEQYGNIDSKSWVDASDVKIN